MNISAAVTDVIIAAILCVILQRSKTGHIRSRRNIEGSEYKADFSSHRSNRLLNKLVCPKKAFWPVRHSGCLDDRSSLQSILAFLPGEPSTETQASRVLHSDRTFSTCACLSLITFLALPGSYLYICFFLLMGRRTFPSPITSCLI